jgi:hypothetical protein
MKNLGKCAALALLSLLASMPICAATQWGQAVKSEVVWRSGPVAHQVSYDFVNWSEGSRSLSLGSSLTSGIAVTRAHPDEVAGLRLGDVIVAMNGRHVANLDEMDEVLRHHVGRISLEVRRNGVSKSVTWMHSFYAGLVRRPVPDVLLPPPPPEPHP